MERSFRHGNSQFFAGMQFAAQNSQAVVQVVKSMVTKADGDPAGICWPMGIQSKTSRLPALEKKTILLSSDANPCGLRY